LCGPSGAGKTWASKQLNNFNIIDVDILGFDKALQAASAAKDKSLVVINTQATRFVKTMAQEGIRCFTAIINEDEGTIKHRLSLRGGVLTDGVKRRIKRYATLSMRLPQFNGTQSEVIDWLKSQL
jgi:PHP family Zn ribbon phosphoesterase